MARRRRSVRTLVVVSATYHHRHDGRLWAYAPYARELAVWADLVPDLLVVAPEVPGPPPADTAPIDRDNVRLQGLRATGGETRGAKLLQLLRLPELVLGVVRALRGADAVHVRAPGNIALLGILLGPVFSRRLVAKYAGQWVGYPEEPGTVRFQRAALRSWWWRGPVTVYGDWPDQPAKVVPFFTSVLDHDQVRRAEQVAAARRPGAAMHVLFVGRLTAPKNVDAVIAAVANLVACRVEVRLTIVGDGPERSGLEAMADRLGIADRVHFDGALRFDEVLERYQDADVLALVSESEGWPKAIAEAMCFGVVCVGSDRGLVPWMLEDRGLVVPPGDADALAVALRRLAGDREERARLAARAAAWGSAYSLDGLGRAVHDLLEDRWHVRLAHGDGRLHVLQVTDTLHAGGAERVAVNLANLLPRDRWRVSLCTTRAEGPLAAEVAADVHRLSLGRGRWRVGDVIAIRRLARYLRDAEVDVVHAHGTSIFIAAAAAAVHPVAVVWHDHLGAATDVRSEHLRAYRVAAGRADVVITVNWPLRRWAQEVLHVPGDRVVRLPNFVLPTAAGLGGPAPALPPARGPRIACVANLRVHKDHQNLLDAMAVVHRRHPDAELLLAGAAPDPELALGVQRRIDELGLQEVVVLLGPRTDVGALLAQCQLGVLSSSSEGFPLALLEYATAGLGVVSTDVGDCAEVLDGGRLGRLVPPRDSGALAAALVDLLDHPDRARALGEALRRSIPARYSGEQVVAQVERTYRLALGRPVSP